MSKLYNSLIFRSWQWDFQNKMLWKDIWHVIKVLNLPSIICLKNKPTEIYSVIIIAIQVNIYKENKQIHKINNHQVEIQKVKVRTMMMIFINDNFININPPG